MSVTCGVPQGAGLSAELFLIYINDLCNGAFQGSITAFADDTALSYCASGKEQLVQMLKDDLYYLSSWFQMNALELNTDKSNIIVFKLRSNNYSEPALEIPLHSSDCIDSNLTSCDCKRVAETNQTKYLGIMIESNLSWTQQILKLRKSMYSTCRKLYYIRNLCPKYMLSSLYYALVESRLQYGIVVWGGTYLSTLKPLLIGHKYIMRTIARKHRLTSSFPIFKEWGLLPLRYLYFYKVLITFFVRSGDQTPEYGTYNLRSTGNWIPPKPYKELFRRFYLYVAPRVFNMLPTEIKQLKSQHIFRKELKKWLFEMNDTEELFKKLV